MGTLAQVLEQCGWVKNKKNGWEPPAYLGESRIEIPRLAVA